MPPALHMKITYTGPNRSSNYAYAQALFNNNALYAFITGFSRLSPRANAIKVGNTLKRHDFFQTIYVGLVKYNVPVFIANLFNRLSNKRLDNASYKYAVKSDVFLFYRTQGLNTTRRIQQQRAQRQSQTICVMEEVNSHVEYAREILFTEYQRLGLNRPFDDDPDHKLRLKTYDAVDYILCPSEFVKNSFLEKGFSPNKLLKVNFGFPAVEVENAAAKYVDNRIFRVLYVGQIHFRKGLHYAIEAFSRVKHPNKEFIIVGPTTVVTGLEKTTIPPNVQFTGALKGDALRAQYLQATCFVLPSLEEGLALVQCEALSFGLPILITTNTGGADVITDGVEGFIVPPCDAVALQEKLQLMADDYPMLARMSEAASQTARKLGSWDAAGAELVLQFNSLTAPPVPV